MNQKEQDAFLKGYNAGLQVAGRSYESGETLLGDYPRIVRKMSLKTIQRLIRTYLTQ